MSSFLSWKSSFSMWRPPLHPLRLILSFTGGANMLLSVISQETLYCDLVILCTSLPPSCELLRMWESGSYVLWQSQCLKQNWHSVHVYWGRVGRKEQGGREGGKEGWRSFGQMHWNGIHDILISSSLRFSLFFKIKLKSKITYWMTFTHDTLAQFLVNDA